MTAAGYADRAALWLAVALGFSIPISTALDNLLVAALLLCFIAGGRYREKLAAVRNNAFVVIPFALFLMHLAGALYSKGEWKEVLHAIDKASILLLIPLLVALNPNAVWRERALVAFMAALLVTLALSYLVWLRVLPEGGWIKGVPSDPVIFKLHITHSVLMAFGAFLFAVKAREVVSTGTRVFLALTAALAAFNVLFMVHGRTGQLVLLSLLLFGFVYWLRWRGIAAAAVAGLAIGGIVQIMPSSSLLYRAQNTIAELKDWRAGKPAQPSNMRPETWRNSAEIVRAHPIVGVGTGGFPAAYAHQTHGTQMRPVSHPENQYLLIAVQFGLVGLAVVIAAFFFQWRLSGRLAAPIDSQLARGLIVTMAVGCLFNSFLVDHTESLFYAWLTGLLFAGLQPRESRNAG